MYFLIFDTETTGLPKDWNAPFSQVDNWPFCVQLAWQLHDETGRLIEHQNHLVYPEGYNIPYEAEKVHGISTALAQKEGKKIAEVLNEFLGVVQKADFLVGQNLDFDLNIMGAEFFRFSQTNPLLNKKKLDTCSEKTAELCRLPGGKKGKFKFPNLSELHNHLFGEKFAEAHNASADVEATARCFFELIRQGNFEELAAEESFSLPHFQSQNPQPIPVYGLKHENLAAKSAALLEKVQEKKIVQTALDPVLEKAVFAHLHNHSQYSVLQSTIGLQKLIQYAAKEKQPAVALTDTGNMMGAFEFVESVKKHNQKNPDQPLKAIVGCELNVCKNRLDKTNKDNGYPLILLAKNKKGYQNLAILSSLAYTEGFYYLPRIDEALLQAYKEDLICLSGGIYAQIPQWILTVGEKQAEALILQYKDFFGEDFYLELQRHGDPPQQIVNDFLMKMGQKHQISLVATNNNYYLEQKEAVAHDILLCVKEGEKQSTPIGKGRGFRYGWTSKEYYFKSSAAMKTLFADVPEAILNIEKILEKIENYSLASPVLLPKFNIPPDFSDENAYLRYLVLEGAKMRYPQPLEQEIQERIDFELAVIQKTGYPGYFLIVQDFIAAARNMGVVVGPGRGSAAGSVVAYCTGITNVDPLAYGLLFERFLNPDRVSMPDIDIDFDDEGRQKVIDYVIEKYGSNQVAQIITYGTMAAKSAIRDTARVLDLPLSEADRLSKTFPDLGVGLRELLALEENAFLEITKGNSQEKVKAEEIRKIAREKNLLGQTLQQAAILEGSLRNTGTHACGLIITPNDMKTLVPVALVKDSEMFCTQFDNAVAESAGLLKMDFLGLRTLTIIRDACKQIEKNKNIKIDIEKIPIDDPATYALFQKGETVGVFQYESAGMQKYLKDLKPTVFGDLVAMNALYRPGPLQYIPSFIKRKNGQEPIQYDIEITKKYLEETYGIVVYQEQVMLLSQLLADFSKGEADALRKAMGKKQRSELDKMKPQFLERAGAKGHSVKILEKIWTDWEAFASYAFNKSHSVCYAWVAYQTAYLKANFPAEYMAAVLSNNLSDIKAISFFIAECKRMKIEVLRPDINESGLQFQVNAKGNIRFSLGAIKGVGSAAAENILKHQPYTSIFDFVTRVDLRQCNKKTLEALALAGAFDGFETYDRADYFGQNEKKESLIEHLIKYGSKVKESKQKQKYNLFGDSFVEEVPKPKVFPREDWSLLYQLEQEKEVLGIYISGHPLDQFAFELKLLCNTTCENLKFLTPNHKGKIFKIAGMIGNVQHKIAKNGNGYGSFVLKDLDGEYPFMIFGEDYLRFKPFLTEQIAVYLELMVVQRFGKMDELDLRIQKIELLNQAAEKYCKQIGLQVYAENLNEQNILDLEKLVAQYAGNKNLLIYICIEGKKFPFRSKKTIAFDKLFFEAVEEIGFEVVF